MRLAPSGGEAELANITIRSLDDSVTRRLRVCASEHHRSMEEEVSIILREAVNGGRTGPRDLAKFTRECFVPLGGVVLELPPRCSMRKPPVLSYAGKMLAMDTNVASELTRPMPMPAVAAKLANTKYKSLT